MVVPNLFRFTLSKCFTSVLLVLATFPAFCQPSAGEVMFVGFNADGTDGFSIVTLVDLPANTTIYFNDNEWNEMAIGAGGAFLSSTEQEFTWDSGAGVISSGTVITFSGSTATTGTLSGGTISLAATNEVIYAFLGTDNITPTTFLSAIANDGFSLANGSLVNTGLTSGVNATAITGDEDVMVYSGSTTCNSTVAACAAAIANASNWTTQDGTGDQSNDATTPDFPSDVPSSFGGTVLPVELISYEIKLDPNNKVSLKWSTASELNNDFFSVERSQNGNSWSVISKIKGHGTTSQVKSYRYTDSKPLAGTSYYRLKQTDFDGQFEYFDVKVIRINPNVKSIDIYPNPASQEVMINGGNNIDRVIVKNIFGDALLNFNLSATNRRIDVKSLTPGVYFLYLKKGNEHIGIERLLIK